MKERKSFIVYYDWYYLIKDLSNEQIAELVRAMFAYNKDGIVWDFKDERVVGIFDFMKNTFDRDNEKYERRCRKNAENAKKRWEEANVDGEHTQQQTKRAPSEFPPIMIGQ